MRLHLIFIILVLTSSIKAQLREFTIAEMPRPEVAVVQANTQFADDALVLIYSTIESLEIRSSLGAIDKVSFNASASRYEVLVKPVKQMLFAAKAGFIEAKIATLNPNPKDVVYYKVEEQKNVIADAATGKLSIQSEPAGADIFLNGTQIINKTPYTSELNAGVTRIKLKKKKFEDFDTSIVVLSKQVSTLNAKLNSSFLYLNVTSNPAGASVSIDGVELGKTPLNKEIDLSNKALRRPKMLSVAIAGYVDAQEMINFYPAILPVELNFELKKQKGDFIIVSEPAGASVYFDGVYKGITPFSGTKEYGSYEIHVQLDDYRPSDKKRLVLNNSQIQELVFKLFSNDAGGADGYLDNYQNEQIVNQVWAIQNLNTDRFQNGSLISEATTAKDWRWACDNKRPAWCNYDNLSSNGDKYGKLYNWYAVADARGLCPAGWHVPSDAEWTRFTEYLGGLELAGTKMKSESGWSNKGNGNNFSGFNGLPGGYRFNNWAFEGVGENGSWWSSTENDPTSAWARTLDVSVGRTYRYFDDKRKGFSVRCIKD
jgi:uncharacterized protein (TIGR02145 family)